METFLWIYTLMALYGGYRFMDGRIAWLEINAPLNKLAKLLVSYYLGCFIGVLYFVYSALREIKQTLP